MKKPVVNQPIVGENESSHSGAETPTAALTTRAAKDSDNMAEFDSTSGGKAPAFQFYPKDFLTDENVRVMSLQERGAYITLICLCWAEGTLPSDLDRLAKLCGVPLTAFRKLWPALSVCFRDAADGRLIHPRLEREREKQDHYRRRQTDASRKRWDKPKASRGNPVGLPVDMRRESSSSSISYLQSSSADKKTTPAAVVDARSRRPIYTSDRFAVFEWQFDELSQMLGPHFESFDLHAFFDALSQKSRTDGLVIPRADAWPWLQARVLAEAKRRNLPMASAAPTAQDKAAEHRAQAERVLAEIQESRRAGR